MTLWNGLVGADPRRCARAASTVTQFSQVGKGRISAEGIQLAYDLKQHLLGEVLGIRRFAQHSNLSRTGTCLPIALALGHGIGDVGREIA